MSTRPLEGRVAIVTGASRGIGRQICLTLAQEGCRIVAAAKSVEEKSNLPGTVQSVIKEVRYMVLSMGSQNELVLNHHLFSLQG